MLRHCTACGGEFRADRRSRKFCSTTCYQDYVKEQVKISATKQEIENRVVIRIEPTNGRFDLLVLGDVHNNREYLEEVVKLLQKHPTWRAVINGDLWDADQFSSHPTQSVKSLSDAVNEVKDILRPVYPQLLGFVWGNHEERCFRRAAGKGTMPSYFDLFFEAVKGSNPDFQVALPMQSMILEVEINGKLWRVVMKHGTSCGKNLGILEFRDVMAVHENIDAIILSHVHIPMHIIVRRSAVDDPRTVHWIRTTAGVAFYPYQDKKNLFISPLGVTKLTFNKRLKVEVIERN